MLAKYGIQGIRFNIEFQLWFKCATSRLGLTSDLRCSNLELNPSWIFHSSLLESKVMKMNWSCLRLKNDRSAWCQFLIFLKSVLFSLILLKDPQKIQSQTSLDSRFPTKTNLLAFYYNSIVPIILTCSWVQRSLWVKQTDRQSVSQMMLA
jgi:hypothetical protein